MIERIIPEWGLTVILSIRFFVSSHRVDASLGLFRVACLFDRLERNAGFVLLLLHRSKRPKTCLGDRIPFPSQPERAQTAHLVVSPSGPVGGQQGTQIAISYCAGGFQLGCATWASAIMPSISFTTSG